MYKKGAQGWLKHFDFIMLDMVCLQLAFSLAYAVRMGAASPYSSDIYRSIGGVLILADIVVSFSFNSFKNVIKRGYYDELVMTIKHVLLVQAVLVAYLFTIQKSVEYSRIVIYLMMFLYICITYFARILWKRHLQKALAAQKNRRSLLIVTVADMAEQVISNVTKNSFEQLHLAGIAILDQDMIGQKISGIPVIGNAENVADAVCHAWVDEVMIHMPSYEKSPRKLIEQFAEMGIVVHEGLFVRETEKEDADCQIKTDNQKQFVENLGNYRVLTTTANYATPMQQLLKRSMDIVGACVGLLLTAVLTVILAPAIYISSPGPVFFSQERVGRNGKHFKIYKFRSMYLDAEMRKKELEKYNEHADGMMFKIEGDPRIIGSKILPDGSYQKGLGNYIRDFSLDEFPQFLNVLKGDMSLVGTRPPTVDEWEKYDLHHRARLAVRPGITGLWQISGRSNIKDFEEVVKLDRKYLLEWSMGLDCRILLQTVKVVFGREGAR